MSTNRLKQVITKILQLVCFKITAHLQTQRSLKHIIHAKIKDIQFDIIQINTVFRKKTPTIFYVFINVL